MTADARGTGWIRSSRSALAAAALVALAGPVAAQSVPGTAERGRALYETRCGACHERSVHQRESRRATDFVALRAEVARWSATSGGEWRDEEIDAVAAWLNERYYRFPCPPTVCRAPARASRS
ncbi:MAG: cytochrome C [Burkholderiales bacterium]|jgi:mono/diheme cytochrome c family protein